MKAEDRYDSLIVWYSLKYGRDPRQVKRQLRTESNFNPEAVNSASGAIGLAQFIFKTPREDVIAYAAGFIDGEGSMGLYPQKVPGYQPYYYVSLKVSNTRYDVLEWLRTQFGVGGISERPPTETQKKTYCWTVATLSALDVIGLVAPYLIIKKNQAVILLFEAERYIGHQRRPRWADGKFAARSDEEITELEVIRQRIHELNRRGPADHVEIDPTTTLVAPCVPNWNLRVVGRRYWGTWEEWCDGTPGVDNPLLDRRFLRPNDPEDSIMACCAYMAWLEEKLVDLRHALAAYNFGIGNVQRGKPWPKETNDYVEKCLGYAGEVI